MSHGSDCAEVSPRCDTGQLRPVALVTQSLWRSSEPLACFVTGRRKSSLGCNSALSPAEFQRCKVSIAMAMAAMARKIA